MEHSKLSVQLELDVQECQNPDVHEGLNCGGNLTKIQCNDCAVKIAEYIIEKLKHQNRKAFDLRDILFPFPMMIGFQSVIKRTRQIYLCQLYHQGYCETKQT